MDCVPEDLVPGAFGVSEPPRPLRATELAAGEPLLVPGLGFDRCGQRLGRGGGYYDRLLAAHPTCFALGVAFGCQLVDRLPVDPWDRPVTAVLTDRELLRPHPGPPGSTR